MTIVVDDELLGAASVTRLTEASELALRAGRDVHVDLTRVLRVDSIGSAWLASLQRRSASRAARVVLEGVRPEVEATLGLLPFPPAPPPAPPAEGLLEVLGGRADAAWRLAQDYLLLCADLAWFTLADLFRRRGIPWDRVAQEMAAMGSRALGVSGLIAFLVGGTMALQSAAQLRQFGASIFVVDLIGVSITRELGPLMAAIIVAGRSGSAVAAELGTMVITEEVDAIRTMGLHPVRYLVVPKVLAITITQPLLTILSSGLGILGGFVVAVVYLDIGPTAYFTRLSQSLMIKDVVTGLIKSIVFAQLIVTIGALFGLRTRGGADAVGRTTTTSVVVGIFAVIVADALASLLFYFGD